MVKKHGILEKIDDYRWMLPVTYKPGMKVPGIIYAEESMLDQIFEDKAVEQVSNVAFLPGIVGYSLAMPDIHLGYGFPIGGVAATNLRDGVISPGGVGFDINCGIRILRTNLTEKDIKVKIKDIVGALYSAVPSGVGSCGRIQLNQSAVDDILVNGSKWAVKLGYGRIEDLDNTEDRGRVEGVDPADVSSKAKERGIPQLGTLGSGNHFLEVAVIDHIYDKNAARVMGIENHGQIVMMIHCGSRGLGHQVCTDYTKDMVSGLQRHNIELPDKQLACAPISSREGQAYLSAMRGAANYAWANRQCITHLCRVALSTTLKISEQDLGMDLIYDVAHNIAKIEEHTINGKKEKLCIHRKGATRSLPAGHPLLPQRYQSIGQPVLIPGDMGRHSFVLVGTERAMSETFGSTCHGAGRLQSRKAAKKQLKGLQVLNDLAARGITVRTGNVHDLAEEASEAYKDVTSIVNVVHNAGISRLVFRTRPLGVVKG